MLPSVVRHSPFRFLRKKLSFSRGDSTPPPQDTQNMEHSQEDSTVEPQRPDCFTDDDYEVNLKNWKEVVNEVKKGNYCVPNPKWTYGGNEPWGSQFKNGEKIGDIYIPEKPAES